MIFPFFISNQGCPHRCIYCRQESITGEDRTLAPSEIKETLQKAGLSEKSPTKGDREIAFFGGTFTGLDLETIRGLLSAAFPFIEDGAMDSVRVSTRPDSLEGEKLDLMWRYGVRTVELGVQSMNKRVLKKTRRGYGPGTVRSAAATLKEHGFRVGVQLMPGLPGDDRETFLSTIREVVEMAPDMVRLYPTLVLQGTALEGLFHQGLYRPLGLPEAVSLCAEACLFLENKGIPVIRMGLQASPALQREGVIKAGPWHPAFGFLVRSEMYHAMLGGLLRGTRRADAVRVRAHPRDIPLIRGHKNQGLEDLARRAGAGRVELEADEGLEPMHPVVECSSEDGRVRLGDGGRG